MSKLISVVVPAYNEAANLKQLVDEVSNQLSAYQFELIVVNDGSKDDTLQVIKQLHESDERIKFVSLARNFGHQQALRCGLFFAKGDAVITMDADLQHPPSLLPEMIALWEQGNAIVATTKSDSSDTPFIQSFFTKIFYRVLNFVSDVSMHHGAADFRLMDRKVVELINQSPENDLFLRGFVEWVGFKKATISYAPKARFAGKSQYQMRRRVSLGVNGLTSFSVKPLRLAVVAGSIISLLAFIYALYALYVFFFTEKAITGWTSLLLSVLFLGGLQMLMIGILGEYIGKIFMQTKGRPNFVVEEKQL